MDTPRLTDFLQDTPLRMMGSETELTNGIQENTDISRLFTMQTIAAKVGKSAWMKNGGRMYQDHGGVIESATPECLSALEAVTYEMAGCLHVAEATTRGTHLQVGERTPTYKRTGFYKVKSNGRSVLSAMSVGHHENYQTPLVSQEMSIYDRSALEPLRSYLATRAIWSGAGIVGPKGYELHQKASAISPYFIRPPDDSLVTHGEKPSFLARNDRLEIRLGDGNMMPWAIHMKFALTSFVLRLIEHDKFPSDLLLDCQPYYAMMQTSRSPSEAVAFRKGAMTPAEHQQAIAHACLDFANNHPEYDIPSSEIDAAHEVSAICNEIPPVLKDFEIAYQLSDRVDWARKLVRLMESGIKREGMTTSHLDAVAVDLATERISREQIRHMYDNVFPYAVDPATIETAMVQPPSTPQTLNRLDFIRNAPNYLALRHNLDWDAPILSER